MRLLHVARRLDIYSVHRLHASQRKSDLQATATEELKREKRDKIDIVNWDIKDIYAFRVSFALQRSVPWK